MAISEIPAIEASRPWDALRLPAKKRAVQGIFVRGLPACRFGAAYTDLVGVSAASFSAVSRQFEGKVPGAVTPLYPDDAAVLKGDLAAPTALEPYRSNIAQPFARQIKLAMPTNHA